MNLTYIIGIVFAVIGVFVGIVINSDFSFDFEAIVHFFDPTSIFIVVVCTLAVVVASFPGHMLKSMPKHFGVMMKAKKHAPMPYIEQLVELAQVARKNGLLALEEMAGKQEDPFFKQAIMLLVDANDPDKIKGIMMNDIDITSERHGSVIGMYEKAAAISPAFGMVGTLIGLVKMLQSMGEDGGVETLGPAMAVAIITTLYGTIMANIIFAPVASNLKFRDEEEVLCRMIIVDGIMSIQSGENPKFLKEKLLTFMTQKERDAAMGNEGGGGGKKKGKK